MVLIRVRMVPKWSRTLPGPSLCFINHMLYAVDYTSPFAYHNSFLLVHISSAGVCLNYRRPPARLEARCELPKMIAFRPDPLDRVDPLDLLGSPWRLDLMHGRSTATAVVGNSLGGGPGRGLGHF